MVKIETKGRDCEGFGRNGYFKLDHIEVYAPAEGDASIHFRSSRSRGGSPALVVGPREEVLKLVDDIRAALIEG